MAKQNLFEDITTLNEAPSNIAVQRELQSIFPDLFNLREHIYNAVSIAKQIEVECIDNKRFMKSYADVHVQMQKMDKALNDVITKSVKAGGPSNVDQSALMNSIVNLQKMGLVEYNETTKALINKLYDAVSKAKKYADKNPLTRLDKFTRNLDYYLEY